MMTETNPLLQTWQTPFGVPPFDAIRPQHFAPAFAAAIAAHAQEIDAIARDPAPATFDNTFIPLEQSGALLERASGILGLLTPAATSPALQELDFQLSPLVAAHYGRLYQNEALFARVRAVHAARATLGEQERRLVETYHRAFIDSGAELGAADKQAFQDIQSRLSELYAFFKQNALAEDQDFELAIDAPADQAGLPPAIVDAAAGAAEARGKPGQHLITMSASLRGPFMRYADRRDLRERVFHAYENSARRGGPHDNRAVVTEIIRLRAALGQLLGFEHYAAYALDNTMAGSPAGARALLHDLWDKSIEGYEKDAADLQALARELGLDDRLQPWDWAYYAQKLRQRELDFDAEAARPYLTLENALDAAFHTAGRLFDIRFVPRPDLPVYDPDVRAWELQKPTGETVAIYYGDFYARGNKVDGGWMSSLRKRNVPRGQPVPVVYNVCNFNKPQPGAPTLLSVSDMTTIFHELGHVLHEALTRADYPMLAGTNVLSDFVELPSQLLEHWALTHDVLGKFARHHETGEIMPEELRGKIRQAQSYRQAGWIVPYIGSCLLDLAWHELSPAGAADVDVDAFESRMRGEIGLPALAQFNSSTTNMHLFDGPGYAALYYIYIWSQVLDSDAFEAFEESGDVFDPVMAGRLHDHIYGAGNSAPPAVLYERFRGRAADAGALLRKLGFAGNDGYPKTGT